MGKEKISKTGLVFLKIVSEQSTKFWQSKLRIFCCFEEVNFIAFFGKNTQAEGNFSS